MLGLWAVSLNSFVLFFSQSILREDERYPALLAHYKKKYRVAEITQEIFVEHQKELEALDDEVAQEACRRAFDDRRGYIRDKKKKQEKRTNSYTNSSSTPAHDPNYTVSDHVLNKEFF